MNILATKFHPPAPLSKGVDRQRLVQQLNQGLASGRRLTLVSAPAGFGKSICISEWVNQLDLPAAWLSLDAADDDPARFFAYFTAALQKVDARLGRELESLLENGQIPPAESICTVLLDDILRFDRPFILVLDDFQILQERAILGVLEMLVANLPPQLHLVMVTREDPLLPLARLRANNQMTEIRAEDLRFNSSEAGTFFQKTMGLSLSTGDLQILENRIEGWVAGLQLAGLSIQGRADPSSFIANLSGTHRYILGYLTSEVLSRQSEELQSFLVQTSILDQMSSDLCDAVTGRSDSGMLLEGLFAANLFLVPLDDEQHWYRYHHLFADLLRSQQNRLPKDQVARLHRSAAAWFMGEGMPAEAIQHALAGEDYAQAVSLLEKYAMSFTMQGHVKTVEGWLGAIPAALKSQSPRAYLAFASVYLMRGNYAGVAANLSLAEAALFQPQPASNLGAAERESLQAEWYAVRANLLNVQGKPADSLKAAELSLQFAQDAHFNTRALAYLGMGGAYRLMGDYPKQVDAYQKAIQNSRAASNSLAEMLSTNALALMAIKHGQLRFAFQVCAEAVGRFERSGAPPPPISGSVYGAMGMVEYEWNQLENARKHYAQALQLNTLGGHNAGVIFSKVILARLAQAEEDLTGAARLTQEAVELLAFGAPAWLKPEVAAQQVRIYLAQNNPVSAEAALNQISNFLQGTENNPDELVSIAHLQIVLHQAQTGNITEGLPEAASLADRMIAEAVRGRRMGMALQMLLVRAKIHTFAGSREAGLEDVSRALQLAYPEGFVRSFIDAGPEIASLIKSILKQVDHPEYARQLLAAFPASALSSVPAPAQAGLVDPLSERELEVLGLMSEGLTNLDIANRLVLSLSTVKTHLINIYGKLDVHSRTEALFRAKELNLL